ncbi:MAG: hypothetical protein IPK91_10510 [Saprospiraceae bacterium]|nr:hypothetical protein [Saprospiraceae bacterium]MBK8297687.1 hypothetical protein [Saprospiraceae bacterium]
MKPFHLPILNDEEHFLHLATTRDALAHSLSFSPKTLIRKLKAKGFILKPGLISPEDQKSIRQLLGFDIEA